MIATICRPMPRRGASSVVVSRSGRPEPRAVTGSLLRSVKVDRSIAEGPVAAPVPAPRNRRSRDDRRRGAAGGCRVRCSTGGPNPVHWNTYNHFVWQADAFLHGRAWFPYPVPPGADLPAERLPPGRLSRSPPRRASRTAGRCSRSRRCPPSCCCRSWRCSGWPRTRRRSRSGSAALGRGAGLVDARRRCGLRATVRAAADGPVSPPAPSGGGRRPSAAPGTSPTSSPWTSPWSPSASRSATTRRPSSSAWERGSPRGRPAGAEGRAARSSPVLGSVWPLDRSQVLAGFLLGLAVTARLPLIFARAVLRPHRRRRVAAAPRARPRPRSAASLPVAALLLYTSDHHRLVRAPRLRLPVPAARPTATRRWATPGLVRGGRPRYIPQNVGIMFGALPVVAPDIKPDTLGLRRSGVPVHRARRAAVAVRRRPARS